MPGWFFFGLLGSVSFSTRSCDGRAGSVGSGLSVGAEWAQLERLMTEATAERIIRLVDTLGV
jgi:hypothetical protein